MILRPASKQELAMALAEANRQGQRIEGADLSALNKVLWHTPEDMTVKVETGITLAELQRVLALQGQWLPIDPPCPESLTVAALLSSNASGPRRFGFGTIRDHLIGLQVALTDGRLASSGGNVVKNVAGYDLLKLFVGARDSLGLPVEAVFKLLPRPEAESFVQGPPATLEEADRCTSALFDSELVPTVLDWRGVHHAGRATHRVRVILGFAGTTEAVQWQVARAAALGFVEPASLDHEREFWETHATTARSLSVLPTRLAETLRGLGPSTGSGQAPVPFVARAGNGLVHYVGQPVSPHQDPPSEGLARLARRVKEIFDPGHILPEFAA